MSKLVLLLTFCHFCMGTDLYPSESDQRLARDIYKPCHRHDGARRDDLAIDGCWRTRRPLFESCRHPVYGLSGLFNERDDVRVHGCDERMPVKSFFEGQTFMYELVKSLAKPAE